VAIVVTAFANKSTLDAARSAGAWQVMSKPVDFKSLLGFMQEALDQPLVMVVDDDHDLCANLWDLLRERGFRVCLAHNLKDAGNQLKAHDYRVVLIDMKLPDGDGTSVFKMIKHLSPQPRTVVISGFRSEMEQRIQQVQEEGADAVCYKPFNVPQLVATLEKLTQQQAEHMKA
jgi:DNA-binding response OmpR family regulator